MCPPADATTRAPFRVVNDDDPLIVLIDDVRVFKDARRSSHGASTRRSTPWID